MPGATEAPGASAGAARTGRAERGVQPRPRTGPDTPLALRRPLGTARSAAPPPPSPGPAAGDVLPFLARKLCLSVRPDPPCDGACAREVTSSGPRQRRPQNGDPRAPGPRPEATVRSCSDGVPGWRDACVLLPRQTCGLQASSSTTRVTAGGSLCCTENSKFMWATLSILTFLAFWWHIQKIIAQTDTDTFSSSAS